MKLLAIRRAAVSVSAVAVLALSTGWFPGLPSEPPVAEAATLAHHRHHGGPGPVGVQRAQVVRHLTHVPSNFHIYHGPHFRYDYNWYLHRHISAPWLYATYHFEPANVCFTEYYFFEGVFYCFVG
jgi:hypothetical protein